MDLSNRQAAEVRKSFPSSLGGGTDMGIVIRFPDPWQLGRGGGHIVGHGDTAKIIILPVVRIERHEDGSVGVQPGTPDPGRGRRRRASRP
jgi:hypothetical protein